MEINLYVANALKNSVTTKDFQELRRLVFQNW